MKIDEYGCMHFYGDDYQVGDLVKYPYEIYLPVAPVSEVNEDVVELDGDRSLRFDDCDIYPIELTDDILRSIGFKDGDKSDLVTEFVYATDLEQSPQTVVSYTFYSKPINGVTSFLKCWTKARTGDGQNDVHLCDVRYLHQLQQALRLCGIRLDIPYSVYCHWG